MAIEEVGYFAFMSFVHVLSEPDEIFGVDFIGPGGLYSHFGRRLILGGVYLQMELLNQIGEELLGIFLMSVVVLSFA